MDKYFLGFYCNFDRSQCGFVQRQDDNFNWIRKKGATPSGGTGPHSDVTRRGKVTSNNQNSCGHLIVNYDIAQIKQEDKSVLNF